MTLSFYIWKHSTGFRAENEYMINVGSNLANAVELFLLMIIILFFVWDEM